LTISEIKIFRETWSRYLDPDDILFLRPIMNWGGKIDISQVLLKTRKRRFPCLSLWIGIFIDVEGNAFPCCECYATREKSDLLLGWVSTDNLKTIYTNEKLNHIRERHLRGEWDDITDCSQCDSWTFYPNIWIKLGRRWH